MQFFEETTLSVEDEINIRETLNYANDWIISAKQGRQLLAEIDLLRTQKAKLLEDVRIALRLK